MKPDALAYFKGKATISIRFENRVMWQKYRKYILKTDWEFDAGRHPYIATIDMDFKSVDDVREITSKIVYLMQLGFDIHSCNWALERNPENIQYPDEEDVCIEDLWKQSPEEFEGM